MMKGVTAEFRQTESGFAAGVLLSINRSKGTEALCNLLKEKSPSLRRAAVEALGRGEYVSAHRALGDPGHHASESRDPNYPEHLAEGVSRSVRKKSDDTQSQISNWAIFEVSRR